MTYQHEAGELGDRLPSAIEIDAANQLRRILATQSAGVTGRSLSVLDAHGNATDVVIPPALLRLLMDLLEHVGQGNGVKLVSVCELSTLDQAADILGISQADLVSLLERGDLEHVTVGGQQRVKAEHLFAYKTARDTRRSSALSALAELDGDQL